MSNENPIRLLLVRHGNTFEAGQTPTQIGAKSDLPLTEKGKNQAHCFAKYLLQKKIKPQAIYAGALKRQVETAQILRKELQLEERLQFDEPALTEIDYGAWEGLTSDKIIKKWPVEYLAWTTQSRWPSVFGGVQKNHLEAIKQWLAQLRARYAGGETVVGVTSNGIIRFFYSFDEPAWRSFVSLGQMETIKVKTGHFCELAVFQNSLQVKSWNLNPV